jgi:hypothetical protein
MSFSLIRRLAFLAIVAGVFSVPAEADEFPPDRVAALDHISADSLRGHLSFLASDLLEGRDTPSKGQEIAAEYIAAQFRRAGLEPVGDDGYFQTANWKVAEPDPSSFTLDFRIAGDSYTIHPESVSVLGFDRIDLRNLSLVKVDDAKALEAMSEAQIAGKAVCMAVPDPRRVNREQRTEASRTRTTVISLLRSKKAALLISFDRDSPRGFGLGTTRLIDPEGPTTGGLRFSTGFPSITIHDPKLIAKIDGIAGPVEASVNLRLGEPVVRPVKLRNVAGLLRGSDPALKDTFILVTAHYDHIGIGPPEKGDAVYNGANDDGSGTVSVIEVAAALGSLKERPKRSILFMTFFGEEKGLLGSRYYGKHPIFPVAKTVADVNLEQVGRTDDSEGPRVSGASMTGMDYSDVGKVFATAGEAEGVKVTRHPRFSDAFFGRSDNQAMADLGVPAHTLCVAFMYADYHGALDHWDKVDYANMAKVDRTVARAVLMIADNPEEPKWDASNPKANKYRKAREASQAK